MTLPKQKRTIDKHYPGQSQRRKKVHEREVNKRIERRTSNEAVRNMKPEEMKG